MAYDPAKDGLATAPQPPKSVRGAKAPAAKSAPDNPPPAPVDCDHAPPDADEELRNKGDLLLEGPLEITLRLPEVRLHGGFATPQVQANHLSRREAAALKVLWCSFSAAGKRIPVGRGPHPIGATVESGPLAIRAVLHAVADALERAGVEIADLPITTR